LLRQGFVGELLSYVLLIAISKGYDMTVDYSKFAPTEYLPKPGVTCPDPDTLETGDLLFPRMRDLPGVGVSLHRNRYSDWLKKTSMLELGNKNKPIKDILGRDKVEELLKKAVKEEGQPVFAEQRSLDITAVMTEGNKKINNNNSLYASQYGVQILNQIFDEYELLEESWSIGNGGIFEDPKYVELIIEILIAAEFGKVVENWFNRPMPVTLTQFRDDPLIQLLLDLLTSDDVRANVFVGHVGIVIRENENVYVIEDNITSYSHYRVAIHPYYVESEVAKVNQYLVSNYLSPGYKSTTDYERPASQTSGWVNRRTAMLEHVWHARPPGLTDSYKNSLVAAAKALHGRPFGFFDHPEFGNNDRMYCAEFVYKAFKDGVSKLWADKIIDKMTWKYVRNYLEADGNNKMQKFVERILADTQYLIDENRPFFVLPPAILWNSTNLQPMFTPGGKPYAPRI
jgi:hypothetical protein